MIVVDTHCHVGLYHFEPIEALLFQMERNGVDRALLIQDFNNPDNSYMIECTKRFPHRFSAVVISNLRAEDALEQLEHWHAQGAEGVRLRPEWRSPGDDSLAIWRKASQLGLAVSLLGNIDDIASSDFRNIVQEFPGLRVLIEHLGFVGRDAVPPYETYQRVLELAQFPNVYMKIPGFGEICHPPCPYQEIPPLVDMAYDAFGARRLMWGSDWPPVVMREGHRQSLWFAKDNIRYRNEEDQEWIFGKTALSLFNLGQRV